MLLPLKMTRNFSLRKPSRMLSSPGTILGQAPITSLRTIQ
jgi:hypothetical protein